MAVLPSPHLTILHVVPFFYPAWAYGGVPRVTYQLTVALAQKGFQIDVVTTDALDENRRRRLGVTCSEEICVRAYRNLSNFSAYHWNFHLPLGLRREQAWISRYDAVHIHGHRNLLNTRIAFWAHRAGVPVVLQPHGSLLKIERRIGLKTLYDLFFGRRQIEKTARFLALSEVERRHFIGLGIPESKTSVVPNGVSITCPGPGESFREKFGIRGDYLFFLGRITPLKGIEHIIRALPLLDENISAVIAGNDMGSKLQLGRLAEKLRVSHRVTFTGFIDSPLKEAGYRGALFTVSTSEYEAFGLVPFESILCGTPAIVSKGTGCGEWIEKSGGGYTVPYGDPQAIARVVRLSVPSREKLRISEANDWISKNLTWDRIAHKMAGIYRDLLSR